MMKNNRIELISKILFFGAIWGFFEATLGYVLHLLPALIAGSIMFPLVMFILYRAYKAIGSRTGVLLVGAVAIMIKATNLFLPFLFPAKTINPMVAMFIQSLLVFLVLPMLEKESVSVKISSFAIGSFSWRILMLSYYGFNYLLTGFLDFRIANLDAAISFVLWEGLISLAVISAIFYFAGKIKNLDKINTQKIHPLLSMAMIALALVLTLVKF
jgi:uncharacterized membrane protein YciS (DUF1049 family)